MAYFRHRRAQSPYQPQFQPPDGENAYPVDEDGDRIYSEEDYGVPASPPPQPLYAPAPHDEAFEPDDEPPQEDPAFDPFNIPPAPAFSEYNPLSPEDDDEDFPADPLSDELLNAEEQAALRRSRWKMLAALADFIGVLAGAVVILLIVMLLVSLLNWLLTDIRQTFTLWQTRL